METMHIACQDALPNIMYARYYSPENTFRFMSVDPKQPSAQVQLPSTWNRYGYVLDNPMALVDLDGLDVYTYLIKDTAIRQEVELIVSHPDMQALYGSGTGNELWIVDYEINPGDVVETGPDGNPIVNVLGESYTTFQGDPRTGSIQAFSVIDPKNNDGTDKSSALKRQHVQAELGHAYLEGSQQLDTHSRAKAAGKRMHDEQKERQKGKKRRNKARSGGSFESLFSVEASLRGQGLSVCTDGVCS